MEAYKNYNIDYSKYTVLSVDDIAANNLVLKGLLTPFKFNIITATSAKEAIEIFENNDIDIILLDKMMPDETGGDGIAVTNAIRNSEKGKDTIIIMISAFSEEDEKQEGYEAGVDDYIDKPVMLNRLMNSISTNIMNLEMKKMMQNR